MPDTTAAPSPGVIAGAPPQELLDEIVRRIVAGVPGVRRIILFGSAARGQMHEDSDIDLLVVLDRPVKSTSVASGIRTLLGRIGRQVDLVAMGESEFDDFRNVTTTLQYDAARNGRVIHAS